MAKKSGYLALPTSPLQSKLSVFAKKVLENAKKLEMCVLKTSRVATFLSKTQSQTTMEQLLQLAPKNADLAEMIKLETRKVAKFWFKTSAISNSVFPVSQHRPLYTVPRPCVQTHAHQSKASVVQLVKAAQGRGKFLKRPKVSLMY
jgi:hypothetical protein